MSLLSDLKVLANNVYDDDNGPWRVYVIDHLEMIRARAKTVVVDSTYIDKFRYDIEWFLREQSVSEEFSWIFRLLNDIPSGLSFKDPGMYYLPPTTYIDELHESYQGTSQVRTA